jgi:phosphoribosylformylglycinamidine synthase
VEVTDADTSFTRACEVGERLSIPCKHTTGRYYAPEDELDRIRVVLRYAPGANPNGAVRDIAGVANEAGNVVGLMPHPEHAVDELVGGSADGLKLFASAAVVHA